MRLVRKNINNKTPLKQCEQCIFDIFYIVLKGWCNPLNGVFRAFKGKHYISIRNMED